MKVTWAKKLVGFGRKGSAANEEDAEEKDRARRAAERRAKREEDAARNAAVKGRMCGYEDATKSAAEVYTSTGSTYAWMAARSDPARMFMFPGRALDRGGASYNWRGEPFSGELNDPVDARVCYVRSLVALDVMERRANASCGAIGMNYGGEENGCLKTCALRIMRATKDESGSGQDGRCAAEFFVVYVHGNAVDVGDIVGEATKIALGLKAHVIAPEFPGYGVVGGTAHEESVNTVVKAAVKYCTKFLNVPQSRMIIMGRSIGTGPATMMARLMSSQGGPPAGLVLQSPYASIRELARAYIGPLSNVVLADRWNIVRDITHVECPTLLIHGDNDDIIPIAHSHLILEEARRVNETREEHEKLMPSSINLYVQEACDHNRYDAERQLVLPLMKWVRKKVVDELLARTSANDKTKNDKTKNGSAPPKSLEVMGCRITAESFMLKYRRANQRAQAESFV